MGLLDDIRGDALSQDVPLSVLLRKCLVLAKRLGHKPFEDWVSGELNGYAEGVEVPTYRRLRSVEVRAQLSGPLQTFPVVSVPLGALPQGARENAKVFLFEQGVSELEHLLNRGSAGGSLEAPFSADLAASVSVYKGYTTMRIWKELPLNAVASILDTVRNRVLAFALDIEAENPDAGDVPVGSGAPVEPERVGQIFNVQIMGDVHALAVGDSAQAQAASVEVQPGDLGSLLDWLRAKGVEGEDIGALEIALVADEKSAGERIGEQTRGWLKTVGSKLASAAGTAMTGVTQAVVTKAIERYLGLG